LILSFPTRTVLALAGATLIGFPTAWAQASGEVDKALLERQQAAENFSLRLRQFEAGTDPTLTPAGRADLELRQRAESQRLDTLHADQLRRHQELQQLLPLMPPAQQQLELQRERGDWLRQQRP
jgi:hypothetical protein